MTAVVRLERADAADAGSGALGGLLDDDAWLTPDERARRDRLVRTSDRTAFTAAHALARVCVAALVGGEPAHVVLVQRCDACGAPGHGRPTVARRPDVAVSLAHTDGWVAALAAPAASADAHVGVDVERVRTVPRTALGARELRWLDAQPSPDAAATSLWVRKEALVKAGVATLDRAADLDVLDATGSAPAVTVGEYRVDATSAAGVHVAWAVPAGLDGGDPRR